jgi:hypothetical protein
VRAALFENDDGEAGAGEGARHHRPAGTRPDDDDVGGGAGRPVRRRRAVERRVVDRCVVGERHPDTVRAGGHQHRDLHRLEQHLAALARGERADGRLPPVGVEVGEPAPGAQDGAGIDGERRRADARAQHAGQLPHRTLDLGGDVAGLVLVGRD